MSPDQAISQRVHARRAVKAAVAVIVVDEHGHPGREHSCQTLDLSRGGVGILSPRLLCPGQSCIVVISANDPAAAFGTVRHVRYVPGRGHVMGLQFAPMPDSLRASGWLEARGVRPVADGSVAS